MRELVRLRSQEQLDVCLVVRSQITRVQTFGKVQGTYCAPSKLSSLLYLVSFGNREMKYNGVLTLDAWRLVLPILLCAFPGSIIRLAASHSGDDD